MLRFAATIFLSAVLLFLVQPMIGKAILPWFGGGASVWTACLLFFQGALLAGYCYAHLLARWLPRRAQGVLHLAMLLGALALLPLAPRPAAWQPPGDANPTWSILGLLVVSLGVPFVLLSATAPLLQRWFSQTFPGRAPYRLYALSNTGSLAALASYPFVVEPLVGLKEQLAAWSWGFGLLVVLGGWCALRFALAPATSRNEQRGESPDAAAGGDRPRAGDVVLWLLLAATGAAMLMATTNQLCQEVAVVPLLWVLPLSVYLLTFIVCFDNARWYVRRWFAVLLAVSAGVACVLLYAGPKAPLWSQVAGYTLVLASAAMTCHGELYRLRPPPRYLTLFYLLVAAGGALGGCFVAVVAPLLFPGYWEFHLALLAACLLLSVTSYRDGAWDMRRTKTLWRALAVGQVALAVVLVNETLQVNAVETRRSFYGVLRVVREVDPTYGPYTLLVHGRIKHGMQYQDADKRRWPTLVFGPQSAIALAMQHHPRRGDGLAPLRVGVVGLGAGTIAVYARPGDVLRFYEINPDVVHLARRRFTFLKDSPAEVSVVLGDARVSLEREAREGSQRFDILVVDAFTNDAIPAHLLTRQCGAVYLEHLKDDGLLLLHISNRFVDLGPVARGLAEEFGLAAAQLRAPGQAPGTIPARWVVLTRNRAFLENPAVRKAITPWAAGEPPPLLWTDDHTGLFQVLQE